MVMEREHSGAGTAMLSLAEYAELGDLLMVAPRPGRNEPGGWPRGAPDVVAEILSPSDTSSAIHMKTLEYLEAGARLVWIVDPEARTVLVHRPDGSANLLREHETISGEDVLSDFSVALREVFDEPRGPE